jgi:hypothetical protein
VSGASHGRLTLVVPGLFGPPMNAAPGARDAARALTEGLDLSTLERLLSRATPSAPETVATGLEGSLFACFGVDRGGGDWPVAAVTYGVDGGAPGESWVLRADPVSLRASMADLTLVHGDALEISMAESEALGVELNDHFRDTPWTLEPRVPHRWYLRLPDAPRLSTFAPSGLGMEPIGDRLPRGDDARQWHMVMNEAQMVLHASPVNSERERLGLAPVNGLWLWGGGCAPRVSEGLWQGVWSDDPLVAGLAALGNAAHGPLPGNAGPWLAELASPGSYLLALCHGFALARQADIDAWRDFLVEIQERWLAPLAGALADGRLQELRIRADAGRELVLTRSRLRRWWRRTRPFAEAMIAARGQG